MLADEGRAEVAFTVTANGVPRLTVAVEHATPGGAARLAPQLRQVGRLVDDDGGRRWTKPVRSFAWRDGCRRLRRS